MALSNWDTLAFDNDGNPCDGTIVSDSGASVEIYKNWLYVRDKRMWDEKACRFNNPTIADIQSGIVEVSDFTIHAERYDQQETMFCFVEDNNRNIMAGIGCYGYDEETWIGVTEETCHAFFKWLENVIRNHFFDKEKEWFRNIKTPIRFNQGDAYFASHLGIDTPASKIGEAEKPIIMLALDGLDKSSGNKNEQKK